MLVVVRRLESVNQRCFKAAALFSILRCIGDEIQIACTVASCVECVCGAAPIPRPQIISLADSQQILSGISLQINAGPRAEYFACLDEARKALECESDRHLDLTRQR